MIISSIKSSPRFPDVEESANKRKQKDKEYKE